MMAYLLNTILMFESYFIKALGQQLHSRSNTRNISHLNMREYLNVIALYYLLLHKRIKILIWEFCNSLRIHIYANQNIKQIYHSWEALVESMGSEVPSTVLFSEGRSPEENSTVWSENAALSTMKIHSNPPILYYTERQKKLITSSGRRSLKSTLSKLIIFGHK